MLRPVHTAQEDRGQQLLSPIIKLHHCCFVRRQQPNRWQDKDSNAQTVLTASMLKHRRPAQPVVRHLRHPPNQ